MVFESILADVLNRILGQYVVNLDASQLKIGIWGGDVVLSNLALKQTALNDLNIPITVVWGRLGRLVLKIPWQNLYSAPVIASIEDLFILIAPDSEIVYNAKLNEKWELEKKESELRRVEEAKKIASQKDEGKQEQQDTFVEKLVTQIIKNVQVEIKNIHIRYEDSSTNPTSPFSIGATISTLAMQSTDKFSNPEMVPECAKFIYKLMRLDGFSIYWNSKSELINQSDQAKYCDYLRKNIPSGSFSPPSYRFLFGPINCQAKLMLNNKPETDGTNFSTPKVELDFEMNTFSVALTRMQFRDMMLLVEHIDSMVKRYPFRKLRPTSKICGHAAEWWRYAYQCILIDVRRQALNWSWEHIMKHRGKCREYQQAYTKLLTAKASIDIKEKVSELEKELDVLNIVLLRERAGLDALKARGKEEKGGYISGVVGWFWGSKPTGQGEITNLSRLDTEFLLNYIETDPTFVATVEQIEGAMTGDEKKKLYTAIGYQENTAPLNYPAHFVERQFKFRLKEATVKVVDDIGSKSPIIVKAILYDFSTEVRQRPSASALSASFCIRKFTVDGTEQGSVIPQMVRSNCEGNENLIDILFENNPIDSQWDRKIHVKARPLTITYNKETITNLQEIFDTSNSTSMNQIKVKTTKALPSWRTMSSMGIQYAVEKRISTEIKVNVMASNIIIPYCGVYEPGVTMLIMKLGHLNIETKDNVGSSHFSIKSKFSKGLTENEIFTSLVMESYTHFICHLTGVQILICLGNEDWEKVSSTTLSPLHLLQPTDLIVTLKKSLLSDDPRIPKVVVEGSLPSITFNASEERILAAAGVIVSISSKSPEYQHSTHSSVTSLFSITSHFDDKKKEKKISNDSSSIATITNSGSIGTDSETVQGIDLICHFHMREFRTNLIKKDNDFLNINASCLEIEMIQKTFQSSVVVRLKGVEIIQRSRDDDISVLTTENNDEEENRYLFIFDLVISDKSHPDFFKTMGGIVSLVNVRLSRTHLILQQSAIQEILDFLALLTSKVEEVRRDTTILQSMVKTSFEPRKLYPIMEEGPTRKTYKGAWVEKPSSKRGDVIDLKATCTLGQISVELQTIKPVAKIFVVGVAVNMTQKYAVTTYNVDLTSLKVQDLNPNTSYPMIVMSPAQETIKICVKMFDKEKSHSKNDFNDMSIKASLGQLKMVYLNRFISDILDFTSSFQTAVNALRDASTAAADMAKKKMLQAYEDSSRIALNINLQAPLVIAPLNSKSSDALVVDLGVVKINNSFSKLECTEEGVPVIDSMKLNLEEFQLMRATVNEKKLVVIYEYPLLHKVSFDLKVVRNLSVAWYNKIPDLEISSRLASVLLTLDEMDYLFVQSVMRENLSEGSEMPNANDAENTEEIVSEKIATTDSPPTVRTAVMVSFELGSFVIQMFQGGVKKLHKQHHHRTQSEYGLAKFLLEGLNLNGEIFSNGRITATMKLVKCSLEDIRKESLGKLNILLETKKGSKKKNMLEIIYRRENNDQFIEVHVCSFTLLLSMEYLMMIKNFIFLEIENEKKPVPVRGKRSSRVRASAPPPPPPYQPIDNEKEPSSYTTVVLVLEKPDILIVHDLAHQCTDALIFHVEVTIKYRTDGQRQVIAGSMSDLQLYSCNLDTESCKKSNSKKIITPVCISLAGSTPEGKGLHLDLRATTLVISLTPKTIQLVTKCLATVEMRKTSMNADDEDNNYFGLWDVQPFNENDFWFLMPDEAVEAVEDAVLGKACVDIKHELCFISFPTIFITLEVGCGNETVPMLYLEMGFEGEVKDWSYGLILESSLSICMKYFNTYLTAWEPIIEPNEVMGRHGPQYVPWQLTCQVVMKNEHDEEVEELNPKMVVYLSSTDNLEITITKTCLEVMSLLGEEIGTAVTATPKTELISVSPQFIVKNDTGLLVLINLKDSNIELLNVKDSPPTVLVQHGMEISWKAQKVVTDAHHLIASTISKASRGQSKLIMKILDNKICVPVSRSAHRFFPLRTPGGSWDLGIVIDVKTTEMSTTLTLRSPVHVINNFDVPIDVHYMIETEDEVELIGTIEPRGKLNLPIYSVFTAKNALFFSVAEHSITTVPFIWKHLQNNIQYSVRMHCLPKSKEDADPFFIVAVGEIHQVYFQDTWRHNMTSMSYNIYLQPTVVLVNSLPTDLILAAQGTKGEVLIEQGSKIQISRADPGVSTITLRMPDYLDKEWSCKSEIQSSPPEFSVWTFDSFDSLNPVSLNLGVLAKKVRETIVLEIYCPFWMINKSGRLLSYKLDDNSMVMYHPETYNAPVLFSASVKRFFEKRKAAVKIGYGEWSEKFSLDVAGSAGMVDCIVEDGYMKRLSVTIELTSNSLTKMIIFTPAYIIVNKTPRNIECMEDGCKDSQWLSVPSDDCRPFWPEKLKEGRLKLRICDDGEDEVTSPFPYHSTYSCLLKLYNKFGGIFVDVHCTASGNYISLYPYESGLAPALVINRSRQIITLQEYEGCPKRFVVQPGNLFYFASDHPGLNRQLVWRDVLKREFHCSLIEDASGEFYLTQKDKIHYICFLDGMQRILLFTEDDRIANNIVNQMEVVSSDTNVNISLTGIGISIVNNVKKTELIYMGLVSSGVIWQTRKLGGKRYKHLLPGDSVLIEKAFQKYKSDQEAGHPTDALVVLHNKLQVNFETMHIISPNKRELQRTFEPGLWCLAQFCPYSMMIHFKINRLQIDNQMLDCIFPVILAPLPPPKTVAAHNVPKPFFELALLERITAHSSLQQYKYFKLLIQEFKIRLDIGLVNALLDFVAGHEPSEYLMRQHFLNDVKLATEPLMSRMVVISSKEQKHFYDHLHLSPIKIHLSFSLADSGENKRLPEAVNVILQSVGVSLTNIEDAILRLSFFERRNAFLTRQQLLSEVQSHYIGQAIRQAYVVLLGLDVLGNPYGLVTGIGEGVEAFFYEPFQGIIQGPAEFAEGLGLGVKSLVGHTVGGAAGAFSKITGTLGSGLAVLTLDKEYQQERLARQTRQAEALHVSVAQGGKDVLMGVVHGVTGVVTKPITGARDEGVGGFFKGVGKGVMGLVTRPVAGVVDFASTSLNAVKRAAELGEGVGRIRPPRFIDGEAIIPYQYREAEGNQLLNQVENRKYAVTDTYQYHFKLVNKDVLLLTDKRFMIISLSDVFATWQVTLTFTWVELTEKPVADAKGVVFYYGRKAKMFGSKGEKKLIPVSNPDERQAVLQRMLELYASFHTHSSDEPAKA